MFGRKPSPYIAGENRLADVIAAIQATGTYKFYKLDFKGWADRISGDESKADYWRKVFDEHPEFFRLDAGRGKASLVWRRQHQKRYHVDKQLVISRDEYYSLPNKTRISRTPLEAGEIGALVETAVNLHARALQHRQESRWWIPILAGFLGAVFGAWVGSS